MTNLTNKHRISPLMAVWLAHDTYDMVPAVNKISVTTLLKSVRQIILTKRMAPESLSMDVCDLINSRLGQSIHAGVEKAWQKPQEALLALGVPQKVVDRYVINPTEWNPDVDIPVWVEIRTEKEVGKWVVSGESDAIYDYAVHDIKSTGIFAYTTGSNNEKYRLQMSMYKWLNLDKVESDMGYIEYYFKDWDKLEASYKPNYPPFPIYQQPIPLLSPSETNKYVTDKLNLIETYWDTPEPQLPLCSSEDLWQGAPAWQYFGSPTSQKASKNFPTEAEAIQWRNAKGKGEVRYKPAKAKACNFCNAASACSQFANLQAQGLIA